MRGKTALWLGLAAACVLTVVGEVTLPFAGNADDMRRLWTGAHALLTGQPPGDLLAVYPPSSAVQYVPLALLPHGFAVFLMRAACAAILVWVVAGFARDEHGRVQWWAFALLLSPPAISLVRLDQFNAALALFALVLGQRLLHSERSGVAGVVAALSMSRPLAAVPVLVGMLRGIAPRRAFGFAAGAFAFFGATVLVAFVWDHHLVHDVIVAGARRPLVGLVGIMRFEFGFLGVALLITMVGLLCWMLAGTRRDRPVDSFVIMLAVSCIGVHFGGPYVAVFALPGLARLAAVASPWWAVGTSLGYAGLVELSALAQQWAIGSDVSLALTLTPLLIAVLPLWLFYRRIDGTERVIVADRVAAPAVVAASP